VSLLEHWSHGLVTLLCDHVIIDLKELKDKNYSVTVGDVFSNIHILYFHVIHTTCKNSPFEYHF